MFSAEYQGGDPAGPSRPEMSAALVFRSVFLLSAPCCIAVFSDRDLDLQGKMSVESESWSSHRYTLDSTHPTWKAASKGSTRESAEHKPPTKSGPRQRHRESLEETPRRPRVA